MEITDQQLLQTLKNHFGYDSFRHPQQEIIQSILSGKDTFALMPTGAGKSLCYQLPALLLPGLTIVISPLIALMKDQVDHLVANGISAGCVNSTMTRSQLIAVAKKVNEGKLKILFLSPERLATSRFFSYCLSRWTR